MRTDEQFLEELLAKQATKGKGYDLSVAMLIAMHFYGSIEGMAEHYKGRAYVRIGERLLKVDPYDSFG